MPRRVDIIQYQFSSMSVVFNVLGLTAFSSATISASCVTGIERRRGKYDHPIFARVKFFCEVTVRTVQRSSITTLSSKGIGCKIYRPPVSIEQFSGCTVSDVNVAKLSWLSSSSRPLHGLPSE